MPGVPDPSQPNRIWLTEAVRFLNTEKQPRDIPASSPIDLPAHEDGKVPKEMLRRGEPYGGAFTNLLVPYLAKRNDLYKDYKNARAALPPPLLREGEKVQPDWLFRFLRDPFEIRPITILRMPKFNLSDDEAMALVHYFAAVDRLANPGEGLSYPYLAIPQRDSEFWPEQSARYTAKLVKDKQEDQRLGGLAPVWEWVLKERLASAEAAVSRAKEAVDRETDKDKKAAAETVRRDAEQQLAALQKEAGKLKEANDLKDEKKKEEALRSLFAPQYDQWKQQDSYATDAFRLLTNYNNPCLGCHNIGNLKAKNRESQGPPLDLAWQRLRPGWTERWVANPKRMISYPTPMPENFGKDSKPYPEFDGNHLEQLTAVRDVLMFYPKVVEMPANRFYLHTTPGGSNK
jgi:hypothetical protein